MQTNPRVQCERLENMVRHRTGKVPPIKQYCWPSGSPSQLTLGPPGKSHHRQGTASSGDVIAERRIPPYPPRPDARHYLKPGDVLDHVMHIDVGIAAGPQPLSRSECLTAQGGQHVDHRHRGVDPCPPLRQVTSTARDSLVSRSTCAITPSQIMFQSPPAVLPKIPSFFFGSTLARNHPWGPTSRIKTPRSSNASHGDGPRNARIIQSLYRRRHLQTQLFQAALHLVTGMAQRPPGPAIRGPYPSRHRRGLSQSRKMIRQTRRRSLSITCGCAAAYPKRKPAMAKALDMVRKETTKWDVAPPAPPKVPRRSGTRHKLRLSQNLAQSCGPDSLATFKIWRISAEGDACPWGYSAK